MRTNVVIDEKLLEAGMKATGLKTKRALINYALEDLVRKGKQKNLLRLRGKIQWEGNPNKLGLITYMG